MSDMLQRLRDGVIISVQAAQGSHINDPYVIAAMAAAAIANGAVGVRIQGVENLKAVRQRIDAPIIGLIKREYPGFEPYITPTLTEVEKILACGADIVAFDATDRPRSGRVGIAELVEAIRAGGALAMADCSTGADGRAAHAAGAQIVGTTLCGYTEPTKGTPLPALALVRELATLGSFTICEGGVQTPADVGQAFEMGANAVVVGTAVTNIDSRVREFVAPAAKRTHS